MGVREEISLDMSRDSSMPHSWAMAGRWSMVLVEQPRAISTISALWKASAVMMSRGRMFWRSSSITCMPARLASRSRAE